MSGLQSFTYRFPLLAPLALVAALFGLFYWVQPATMQMFPIAGIPLLIIILYNYRKYRQGNKEPLERFSFRSAILLLTLAVLFSLSYIWQ